MNILIRQQQIKIIFKRNISSSNEIRQSFFNYFNKEYNHPIIPSSSLIPPSNDNTGLLFTNSGMVQFRDNFLGLNNDLKNAVTVQQCIRAGGKHNDLNNVGHSLYHHTFFEMLGNFSFNNDTNNILYKEQAIYMAYNYLINILQLPMEKLTITVHYKDIESYNIWCKLINPNVIYKKDDIDNFWSMGKPIYNIPCGYCTEIFYESARNMEYSIYGI